MPGRFTVRKYYILNVPSFILPLFSLFSLPPSPPHQDTRKHHGMIILLFLFRHTEAKKTNKQKQKTCLAGSSRLETLQPKLLTTALTESSPFNVTHPKIKVRKWGRDGKGKTALGHWGSSREKEMLRMIQFPWIQHSQPYLGPRLKYRHWHVMNSLKSGLKWGQLISRWSGQLGCDARGSQHLLFERESSQEND